MARRENTPQPLWRSRQALPIDHKSFKRLGLAIILALSACGCQSLHDRNFLLDRPIAPQDRIPNAEFKTALPPYVVEPPDILLIDALKVVPKPPYRLEPLDVIQVRAQNVFPEHPIDGNYQIEAAGTINLGVDYGPPLKIAGLTTDEATEKLQKRLEEKLVGPTVSVTLVQTTGTQQIAGEHLVAPDGTVSLGIYGRVYVAGLTLDKTTAQIEKHLQKYLESPKITVDVGVYNSKVYYVVFDEAGSGDRVIRLPITGGETVLDAMSQVGGLSQASSTKMWIARPAPDHLAYQQRLPINWDEITRSGIQVTNYQLLPGDRLFIAGNQASAIDNALGKALAPLERISGTVLLGTSAIRNLNGSFKNNQNGTGTGL